ncbi:MAG TPA: aminotransferase class V-fold PLP-dependent enzyme [Geobacteraceae bacterium]|nr:aminotransferase class V-fold PLP-dependent enzyme [Geobacteraceae bacterium]
MSIYLDNAATTFPKPEQVYLAIEHALRKIGAGPGRGGHSLGLEATRVVFEARENLAAFFGIGDSSRLVFTHSATEGLNLAIWGLLHPGDHVITTTMEHNSLARPLNHAALRGVDVTWIACDRRGGIDPGQVRSAIRRETRLIALSHCSNVNGSVQPVEEIGLLARRSGVLFLVDAAQSAGVIPMDVREMNIDLLAAPGHKGLLGPLGTGVLYVAEGVELSPLIVGGTGGYSDSQEQPAAMPERFESGTLNTPGIAGLGAGVDFIRSTGIEAIRKKEANLVSALSEGLGEMRRVRLYGHEDPRRHCGPVSFDVEGVDLSEVGFILDREYDICVRVGLHCAPAAHRTLGTWPRGTVRVSPGFFNTDRDIELFLNAVRSIADK